MPLRLKSRRKKNKNKGKARNSKSKTMNRLNASTNTYSNRSVNTYANLEDGYNANTYANLDGYNAGHDIVEAKAKIEELNQRIKESTILKRCEKDNFPLLGLSLDYVKEMNLEKKIISFSYLDPDRLLLCLNYQTGCLASIGLEQNGDSIEIFSKTDPEIEGKKFNTLLRCVVMIIAPFLGVKKIVSNAIDPVSAYLLCRYFDGSIVDLEYLRFQASPSYQEMTLGSYREFTKHIELYTEYLESTGDSLWSIFVECPVNEETQQKNDDLFIRYVEATKCINDP
jgi:hypothetical protein